MYGTGKRVHGNDTKRIKWSKWLKENVLYIWKRWTRKQENQNTEKWAEVKNTTPCVQKLLNYLQGVEVVKTQRESKTIHTIYFNSWLQVAMATPDLYWGGRACGRCWEACTCQCVWLCLSEFTHQSAGVGGRNVFEGLSVCIHGCVY